MRLHGRGNAANAPPRSTLSAAKQHEQATDQPHIVLSRIL